MESRGRSIFYEHPAHTHCRQQEIVGPSFNQVHYTQSKVIKTGEVAVSLRGHLTSSPQNHCTAPLLLDQELPVKSLGQLKFDLIKGFLKASPEKEIYVQVIYGGSAPRRCL